MTNLYNWDSETGAVALTDDTTPSLELKNSSTGPGLQATGVVCVSGASVDRVNIASPILAANATLAALSVRGSSVASGAILSLLNLSAYVSCTTIKVATGGVAGTGAIRVVRPDGTFGWIPIYPDGAVTGVAV